MNYYENYNFKNKNFEAWMNECPEITSNLEAEATPYERDRMNNWWIDARMYREDSEYNLAVFVDEYLPELAARIAG